MDNKLQLHSSTNTLELAQLAGRKFSELVNKYSQDWLLLLFSGGSALQILDHIELNNIDKRVTVSVLDERVNPDPETSNYYKLTRTSFFKEAIARGAQSLKFPSPQKKGRIIITQGIGVDGHTAGIFPLPEYPKKFTELFDNPKQMVIDYDAGIKRQYPRRLTVTLPFLRSVDASIVFACGEEKRDALTRIFMREGNLASTPARIIHEMNQVDLFTDLTNVR